jgi:hypothetical protein
MALFQLDRSLLAERMALFQLDRSLREEIKRLSLGAAPFWEPVKHFV